VTTRLKRVATLRAGGTPPVDDPLMWTDKGTPWVSITDMTRSPLVVSPDRSVSPAGLVASRLPLGNPGTILFAMYASVGDLAVLGVRATWNQAILGIEPLGDRSQGRFIGYWLEHLRPELGALMRSNTQNNLNAEQVGNLHFPTMALPRQRAIADYLDAETTRIDALIDKKRRMVELLRLRLVCARSDQFRSATPRTVPLRRLVRCLDGRRVPLNREDRSSRSGPYPYWGSGGVLDYIDDYLFEEELVLLGEDGAPFFDDQRDVAFRVQGRTWINNHIHVLKCKEDSDPRWLRHMLNAVEYSGWITGSTRDKLTQDEMMSIRLPQLDLGDQQQVAGELDALENETDGVKEAIANQTLLLAERRQALITAAVTGELDIPGVAA